MTYIGNFFLKVLVTNFVTLTISSCVHKDVAMKEKLHSIYLETKTKKSAMKGMQDIFFFVLDKSASKLMTKGAMVILKFILSLFA